jgi:PBP4 family serine-type D-alanyl-D-alanine carboxypeptidase
MMLWLSALLALWLAAGPAGSAQAHPRDPKRFPKLHTHIDGLLKKERLARENVALMLFSTRKRKFLYRRRETQPMIAASNAKLATTFAALRVLNPNYRWKTLFYRVTEQNDAGKPPRQGLLVKGGGDPTITSRTMEEIALKLKTRGLHRIDGGLYYDETLFDHVRYPAAWGSTIGRQSWFAPVSPFIVEKNAANFFISVSGNGDAIEVIPQHPVKFLGVKSRLAYGEGEKAVVRVKQDWNGPGGMFTFLGHIPRAPHIYTVATAVNEPVAYFFNFLRHSLRRLGIKGEMPLRGAAQAGLERELLHTHYSGPLRGLIVDVNKESNNLTAEVVVRALALTKKPAGASGAEGLKVLREALAEDFPRFSEQVHLADGSGLSRETKVSASFMVHLLSRVMSRHEFRSEFISSLSLGGWDGTLQYRKYPDRFRGRLRAKSGTLSGVQNLSGYIHLLKDIVIFSFLINDSKRNFVSLQKAQDRVLTGMFDRLMEMEAPQPVAKASTPDKS